MECKLKVENMVCAGCQKKIEKGLRKIKGVKKVFVDLENKIVTITFQNVEVQEIIDKIATLGYHAEIIDEI